MTDPEKTEDVEEQVEFLDTMERIAEMTGKAHLYPDRIESLRDTIRTLRERLEEVEDDADTFARLWREYHARWFAARRRADQLEGAVGEAKKALNKTIPAGGGVKWETNRWRCSYCGQSDRGPGEIDHEEDCPFTVERRLRDWIAALDSREDEGAVYVCEKCAARFDVPRRKDWPRVCPSCRPVHESEEPCPNIGCDAGRGPKEAGFGHTDACSTGESVAWMVESLACEGCRTNRVIYDGENARETARKNVESLHRTGYLKARAVPLYLGEARWAFDNVALEDTGNVVEDATDEPEGGEVRQKVQAACDCDPGEELAALERLIDYYDGMQAWIEHHFGKIVDEIVLEEPYHEPDPKVLLASDESVSGEGELPTTVDTGRMRREADSATHADARSEDDEA